MNRSVIGALRDFVPIRPLCRGEAMRIAELQATRFLRLAGVDGAPVPERVIAELPRVQVERVSGLPVSGATHWTKGRWLILVRSNEPATRQLFSVAHELKHILDDRFADVLYRGVPEADRARFVEQVCDYFAGCLLVPRPWLKRAWAGGLQRPADLAAHFGVSEQAVEVRLLQVGLLAPRPRCARPSSAPGTAPGPALYHRRLAPAFVT